MKRLATTFLIFASFTQVHSFEILYQKYPITSGGLKLPAVSNKPYLSFARSTRQVQLCHPRSALMLGYTGKTSYSPSMRAVKLQSGFVGSKLHLCTYVLRRCVGTLLCSSKDGNFKGEDSNGNIDGKIPRIYDAYESKGNSVPSSGGDVFRLPSKPVGFKVTTPTVKAEEMTDELKSKVLRVMVDAFDNLPPVEVEAMLSLLWSAGPTAGPTGDTIAKLVFLTDQIEKIEDEAVSRLQMAGTGFEDLEDAIRVARSRVRMYGRDADYYRGVLSLDPWKLPWQ